MEALRWSILDQGHSATKCQSLASSPALTVNHMCFKGTGVFSCVPKFLLWREALPCDRLITSSGFFEKVVLVGSFLLKERKSLMYIPAQVRCGGGWIMSVNLALSGFKSQCPPLQGILGSWGWSRFCLTVYWFSTAFSWVPPGFLRAMTCLTVTFLSWSQSPVVSQ